MAAINNNEDPQFEVYRKRLFDEVERGNLAMIKAIAKKNPALLNCMDDRRHTVLHAAAANSNLDVVEWLLSDEGRAAGFNSVLSKSEKDLTALHSTVLEGDFSCFKAIVFGCKEENGEREQMLNAVEEDGFTVLHYAAMERKPSIIKWLLSDKKGGGREAGFNSVLAKEKKEGMTALHFTAHNGDLECFTAIVDGCKVDNGERTKLLNAASIEGETVLHIAAHLGQVSIIKWLLSKGRDNGFESILATMKNTPTATALHLSAQEGHLEACKAIVAGCKVENGERGQMLNDVDDRGLTPLHYAARTGHTSVVNWLLSDKQGGGRTLGFNNIFARLKQGGSTALQLAVQYGHLETCKAIVNGCKVENGEREKMLNDVDERGLTVVHYAASCGRLDIIPWLLSHDTGGGRANGLKSETITTVANGSVSALHYAVDAESVETLRALLSGCTVGEKLKMFLACDQCGWTSLQCAAKFGRIDNIRELLLHHEETRMIVDHRDYRGMTALHRVILDGGVDEESKNEWNLGVNPDDPNRAPREEVVAALLTYEIDDDDDEKGGAKGQAASSSKKPNKQKQQQQQQQQQAAFIDVNLGLKIEKKENDL